jgi:hypothetical protein
LEERRDRYVKQWRISQITWEPYLHF